VGRFTDGSFGEGSLGLFFDAKEGFVFEEPGSAEGVKEMLFDFADFDLAGGSYEILAEVEAAVLAVEKLEARDEAGGDDESRVGVLEGVTNDEARAVGNGRGEEVEIAEAGEHGLPSLD
jgi:hypothetical protein